MDGPGFPVPHASCIVLVILFLSCWKSEPRTFSWRNLGQSLITKCVLLYIGLRRIPNQAICEWTNKQIIRTIVICYMQMNLKPFFSNFYLSLSETLSFPTCSVCVCVCMCVHFPASFGWNNNHVIQQTFPLRVEIFFHALWPVVKIPLGANPHRTVFKLLTSYWLDPVFCSTPYRCWNFLFTTTSLSLGSTYITLRGILSCANGGPQG
jgi:hypothetical protein